MFLGSEKFFHPHLLSWFGSRMDAARIFINNLPRVWRTGLFALNALLVLSLYDALFGGGISAALKYDGWYPIDQAGNDFYQASFGVVCLATFLLVRRYDKIAAWILAIMLLGYWEDLFFYLILPGFSPIFEWRGLPEVTFGLPEEISGWMGFVSRVLHLWLDTPEIKLGQLYWAGLMVLSLSAVFGILAWMKWQEE